MSLDFGTFWPKDDSRQIKTGPFMPTSQQSANDALARWQELRASGLTPDQRLQVLMDDFFAVPAPSIAEYEITLRNVAAEMEAA